MRTILLLASCALFAQSQNKIPFASSNNTIELSVANTSTVTATNVVIEVTSAPEWIKMNNRKLTFENLNANENKTAQFTFSIDKSATVNKPEHVTFTITNSNGERWTKTLLLQVSPPEKFELFQNYPNPFNPTTVISYQIPVASIITLKIFDAIGREVATIDEGVKEAGYHQKEWNATNIASGFYIYQLSYSKSPSDKTEKGEQKFLRKKMVVIK